MTAVPELTKPELSNAMGLIDPALKTWFDSSDPFPPSFGVSEFVLKMLQAGYVAENIKNTAANNVTPLVEGESLASFAAPATSTVTTNATTGVQSFTQTVSVTVVTAANSDFTVAARV
jgi:hypothetical protein